MKKIIVIVFAILLMITFAWFLVDLRQQIVNRAEVNIEVIEENYIEEEEYED